MMYNVHIYILLYLVKNTLIFDLKNNCINKIDMLVLTHQTRITESIKIFLSFITTYKMYG